MECPILKICVDEIKDSVVATNLCNMKRDWCIEEDCSEFKDCWGEKENGRSK